MGKVVLIDDSREFRDGRECLVARTPVHGLALLKSLYPQRIDELWLDHDLGGDRTIWPVVRLLEDYALQGIRWDIGVVKVHANDSGRAHEMIVTLRRAGYPTERVAHLGMFRRARPRPVSPPVVQRAPEEPEPTYPDRRRLGCTLYTAGHNVHWIQALHTANKPEVSRRSWAGRIESIDGQRVTVRRKDGRTFVLLNHDPERLRLISADNAGQVVVNDQYALLRVRGYCFSVKRDDGRPLTRCLTDELPEGASDEQRAERLETHGGFSVPVGRRNVSGTRENDGRGGAVERP